MLIFTNMSASKKIIVSPSLPAGVKIVSPSLPAGVKIVSPGRPGGFVSQEPKRRRRFSFSTVEQRASAVSEDRNQQVKQFQTSVRHS